MPGLEDFAGRWAIERRIEDARAAQIVRFTGQAVLRPAAMGGLDYVESGVLAMPGQRPITARRRYLWRQAREAVEIFFDDGRFFHSINPGPRPRARHVCPPDTYEVGYDFTSWPAWCVVWQVKGPRKDYRLRSAFTPLGACTGREGGAEDAGRMQQE
ncbi:hypothetical protein EV663_10383 [Rhodovulum bhavnagarense]|uniref:DUF6314 domain-containing protein n=1 Tax=Rhodovulum bhavnagarense TaxID=992286 RepID=A0A4R2RH22_9RHOB|nr:DUF6314 family protein [Rhodovulum bhavnagarense]TCP61898.1 hypothetical protein EV663_10383 [Rhodovulum bhavnagarense]